MRYIKIFLASSTVDFKHERREIGDFIRSLNDAYIRWGIYIRLFICEDYTEEMTAGRKQDEYNDWIRKCDLFYVLVDWDIKDGTKGEFEAAYQNFKLNGSPKIYTYFRQEPADGRISGAVQSFMNELNGVGHYYSFFSHIDQIKIRMLGAITRELGRYDLIDFKSDMVRLDGVDLISLKNIDMFKARIGQKEFKDEEMKKLFFVDAEIEGSDYRFDEHMNRAMGLIGSGKFEEAVAVLSDVNWYSELKYNVDGDDEKNRVYITAKRLLISLLAINGVDSETKEKITQILVVHSMKLFDMKIICEVGRPDLQSEGKESTEVLRHIILRLIQLYM